MVGDFWFTCWVDAGQPDLDELAQRDLTEKQKKKLEADIKKWDTRTIKSREHN